MKAAGFAVLCLTAACGLEPRPRGDSTPDAGRPAADTGPADSGRAEDAGQFDDAGPLDAGLADVGPDADAGTADTGAGDAGPGGHRTVFITSAEYGANLAALVPNAPDGAAAGDELCRQAAARGNRGASFRAWLSTDDVDAIHRLAERGPWYTTGGELVFSSKAEIPNGPQVSIWLDENGGFLPSDRIWTGTIFDGTRGPASSNCLSWTTDAMSELARIGQVGRTGDAWTFQSMTSCDQAAHLICFEQ